MVDTFIKQQMIVKTSSFLNNLMCDVSVENLKFEMFLLIYPEDKNTSF